jgi:DNA-binding transcriptional regulator YiaG
MLNRIIRAMKKESPTPEAIRQARNNRGMTQTEAAALVYSALRTWQQWESGDRTMHPAIFELFLIKTHQHLR